MREWRFDRTAIFLFFIGLLFLWDAAYILKFAGFFRFPDIFEAFRKINTFTFLKGFPNTLNGIILLTVFGYGSAVGLTFLTLRKPTFAATTIRFLRIGLWLPFLLVFAIPKDFIVLSFAAVILASWYQLLVARLLLKLDTQNARIHVVRQALLQAFFISLLTDLWWDNLILYRFPVLQNGIAVGLELLAFILFLLFVVNWFLRFDFDKGAAMRRAVLTEELKSVNRSNFCGVVLLTIGSLTVWYILSREPLGVLRTSPEDVLKETMFFFKSGEIITDIFFSLLEICLGLMVCVLLGLVTYKFLSAENLFSRFLKFVLPLTYISMIVVWLLGFLVLPQPPSWPLPLFHQRVFLIALLAFYPFIQALWGLRNRPFGFRLLMAVDDALPVAFVVMILSEAYAATEGVGFMMIVAAATSQTGKALVGVSLSLILLIVSSILIRTAARKSLTKCNAELVPSEA